MLTIQLEQAGGVRSFRILGTSAATRLVMVMVKERTGEQSAVWVVGLPGMRVTEHPASDFQLVDHRPATEEDIRQFKARGEELLGHAAVPIAEITYGVVPPGFQQIRPANGSPVGLRQGEEYEVVVVAVSDFGSLEFVV